VPKNAKPGAVYTLRAVFDSGPLAGKLTAEKKVTVR
jgi:hypothetical protein